MSNYLQLLQHIYSLKVPVDKAKRFSVIHKIDQKLGYLSKQLDTIHIAGTNGKGSVATKIAEGLRFSGEKVGLFTSPHLVCFRERICISGEKIPERKVCEKLKEILHLYEQEGIPPLFFDLTFFLAMLHFVEEKVDIAVIETGLGGRYDVTNILQPLVSVITSIGIDHTNILGHTLEEIAWNKGGIIKPSTPVFVGPTGDLSVIREIAKTQKAPCDVLQCKSDYEQENQALAKRVLEHLSMDRDSVEWGVKQLPLGRFEYVKKNPLVIFDGAHNPQALEAVCRRFKKEYPEKPLNLILGMRRGKEINSSIQIAQKYADHLLFPNIPDSEFVKKDEYPIYAEKIGPAFNPFEGVLITGSFFLKQYLDQLIKDIFEVKDQSQVLI